MHNTDPKMDTLCKHWLAANSIKVRIDVAIPTPKVLLTERKPEEPARELRVLREWPSMALAICVWYALIYVVIEGYEERGLHDKAVDALLEKREYVKKLKRFRNAMLHVQKDPMSAKMVDFLQMEQSAAWVQELNSAFDSFFGNYSPMEEIFDLLGSIRPAAAQGK